MVTDLLRRYIATVHNTKATSVVLRRAALTVAVGRHSMCLARRPAVVLLHCPVELRVRQPEVSTPARVKASGPLLLLVEQVARDVAILIVKVVLLALASGVELEG